MECELSAGRGADEICSCLHQYITNLPPQVKKLTCFSDSCFGQNKNFQMICFWNWQINQGRFSQVDHKFLVRGHTYLPNDRHIEKRKDSAVIYIMFFILVFERMLTDSIQVTKTCAPNLYYTIMTSLIIITIIT